MLKTVEIVEKSNPDMIDINFGCPVKKVVEMRDVYGLDGAMIGRASIGYPWFFNEIKHFFKTGEHLPKPTISQRTEMAKRHLQMAIDWKGERLGVVETR